MEIALKKIIEYLALLAILGFFIPYSFFSSYYGFFNIDILMYADFKEILIQISFLILFIFSFIYACFPLAKFIERIEKKVVALPKCLMTFMTVFLAFSISCKYFLFNISKSFGIDTLINAITLVLYICTSFSLLLYLQIHFIKRYSKVTNLILFVVSICLSLFLIGSAQAKVVITMKEVLDKYSFTYNNKVIKTDSTLVLIGQTNSSIFLYDKLRKETYVYKRDKIDSLVIQIGK